MDKSLQEIASLLRSTEEMAEQFAQRVASRVDEPVSHADILAVMKKLSNKNLSLDKVVAKLQQRQRASRSANRRRVTPQPHRQVYTRKPVPAARQSNDTGAPSRQPRTIMTKLEALLQSNWDRAEAEGLHPERMSPEAFVKAVYQHTDRRHATHRRILQAAQMLDQDDVLLTPALVADLARQIFQG